MQKGLNVKKLLVLVIVIAVLIAPVVAYAQDAAPTDEAPVSQTAATPEGLGTFVLLVGLAALAIVGGRIWFRDRYSSETETKS
jgi:hypothetical protein